MAEGAQRNGLRVEGDAVTLFEDMTQRVKTRMVDGD